MRCISPPKGTVGGLILSGVASLFFSCQNTLTKVLQNTFGIAVFEIILTRSITVTSFLLLVARVQGTSLLGHPENRAYLIVYAFLRILAITLCFFAIGFMPLYAFTIIIFTYPSIACICTYAILGEPFGPFDICSSICSLLGVVLISEPSALGFHTKDSHPNNSLSDNAWNFGILLGLCGAVALAFATVTLRKLGGREPTNVVIFYQNGMGLIFAPIGMAFQGGKIPGAEAALLMCTIPVIAILAQSCQTMSLSSTVASKILPMSYLEVLFSTLIGTVLLKESMDLFQIIGAVFVVASAVAYFFKPDPTSQLPANDTELAKLPEVEKNSERIAYTKLIDSDEFSNELNDDVEDCLEMADDTKR